MTNRLIPVRVGAVEVLVETVPVPGSQPTSRLQEAGRQVVESFDHARDAVVEIAASTAQAIDRLHQRAVRPEQVEVEFGLKFSAQGNVIVAGAAGEASLVVRMTYRSAAAPDASA
ncbi:CU044_2847 family protein [Streptomyces sp. NPDC005017]|uniref:CU044_2847 family protein n=1 Tax=Streptomyces sp. NPDC005017 TaxID=3364706 RepID=UPI00367BFEF2